MSNNELLRSYRTVLHASNDCVEKCPGCTWKSRAGFETEDLWRAAVSIETTARVAGDKVLPPPNHLGED